MKYNNSTHQHSAVRAIGIGFGISIILTVIFVFIAACAISTEYLEESQIGYIVMGIIACATALGAYITIRQTEEKRLPSAMAVGAAYYILLLAMGILLFDGPDGGTIVTGVLVTGCCGCVSLLALKGKKRKYGAGRKYINR